MFASFESSFSEELLLNSSRLSLRATPPESELRPSYQLRPSSTVLAATWPLDMCPWLSPGTSNHRLFIFTSLALAAASPLSTHQRSSFSLISSIINLIIQLKVSVLLSTDNNISETIVNPHADLNFQSYTSELSSPRSHRFFVLLSSNRATAIPSRS